MMNSDGPKPPLLPPLLQDQDKLKHRESHHVRPKAHEEGVAEDLDGMTRPGSGAFQGLKGDAIRPQRAFPLLIECKRGMDKMSVRLEARHLTKISEEADGVGAYPALDIQFDVEVMEAVARADGRPRADENWIAVPRTVFKAMLEALGEEGLGL